MLDYLEVHLTNHCNLNCAYCCHFSPIAEEYFMPIEQFKSDFERLAILSGGNIRRIRLMGGEPLLHPDIKGFIKIARKNFPKYQIAIHTNGILLNKMEEEFWKTCAENNVEIIITNYPVKIDYTLLNNLAVKNKVILRADIDTDIKYFRNMTMDLKGTQSYKKSWHDCIHANACTNLFEGKLYTCDILAHSKHLAKYFNISFEYTNKDYVDIYKEKSMDNILKKLSKPIPFCRYCSPKDRKIVEWHVTKKELNEWVKV
jgi:MoaA/NifB/PqqE/SkfB family radical SAM enzyme